MENIFEENTIKSKSSEESAKIDPKKIEPVYPFFEMWIMSEELKASVYTFPSQCILHKENNDFLNCKYKIHQKTDEKRSIEKFCMIKFTNFIYYMGYLNNYRSSVSISAYDINVDLNKKFPLFSHYINPDIIKRAIYPGESGEKNKKMLDIEINKHFDKISDWKIKIHSFQLNLIIHAILTLKNFFSRFFLYYHNKNIKFVNHGEPQKKRIDIKLKNSNFIMKHTLHNSSDTIYELDINLGLRCVLMNYGDTWVGPFKDSKMIQIYINKMFLNNIKHSKGKPEVKLSNKILSCFSFFINLNCESTEQEQKQNRTYYIYISKSTDKNLESLFKLNKKNNSSGKLNARNPIIPFQSNN